MCLYYLILFSTQVVFVLLAVVERKIAMLSNHETTVVGTAESG